MATITNRKRGNKTYYYYQETYRVKLNPQDRGKNRGSGKSKVRTKATYLGTADDILKSVQEKEKPIHANVRAFGLIAAAYQTSKEIGLVDVLARHIEGKRFGVPRGLFFFVSILNRLDHATSKNKMSDWLQKTILPDLLGFDAKKFNSRNFWYVTDDVISEKELRERRDIEPEDPIFSGLEEDTFTQIERELFRHLEQMMDLSSSVVCYDTTNFFTYIDEPAKSALAKTCHSKASKHHLKHVGLLMAVEKSHGIPLISRVYRANRHDSKVFSHIVADLILELKALSGAEANLVLVIDKGNNSEENFNDMSGKISWVGALVPSQHQELLDLDLGEYHEIWKNLHYYTCTRKVMGIKSKLVLTFNAKTKRKKEHSLRRGIEKLKREIREKWDGYKTKHPQVTPGIETMLKQSRYGKCIDVSVQDEKLLFTENSEHIETLKVSFGKNLIFSNLLKAEPGYLIDTYQEKNIIEEDFRLLKDVTIIRFQPIRHWTDTKIRAYAFCCVVSMTLMRVMQWKAEQAGYRMSPNVLQEELSDLKEVIMVYSPQKAIKEITERSTVQKKLWSIFNLEEIENMLLH